MVWRGEGEFVVWRRGSAFVGGRVVRRDGGKKGALGW